MADVCVSANFGIDGGVLSLKPWSAPRIIFDSVFNSVGDGSWTTQQYTTLPGKLMIDSTVQSWVSDSPLTTMILLRIQTGYRDWLVSNPNVIQFRDRYTWTIDGTTPRTPDVSSVYNNQSGSGVDTGTLSTGTPYVGRMWEYEDPALVEDWIKVPSGATFKFWYQQYMWTPPPFSNNANNNSPQHAANSRNVRIQLMAFPTQDAD